MKAYYRLKRFLKWVRLAYRRQRAINHWGREAFLNAPPLLGTALPKSGSHLLIQVLRGMVEIGPFVDPGFPPVNRFEGNIPLSEAETVEEIKRMRSGEIRYGYAPCREPYLSAMTAPGRVTVFIYRDPRDLLVSHVFYAMDIHEGHGMHEYYNNQLHTMEERLNVAIEGCDIPGLELPSVWERYKDRLGWFEQEDVLCVRFEDFILNREKPIGEILEYIKGFGVTFTLPRQDAIQVLGEAIQPHKSGTFRKGEPGNWKEHFTPENKARFKAVAGDLLTRLGYEEDDQDW